MNGDAARDASGGFGNTLEHPTAQTINRDAAKKGSTTSRFLCVGSSSQVH